LIYQFIVYNSNGSMEFDLREREREREFEIKDWTGKMK
jgi:hypothetical protein